MPTTTKVDSAFRSGWCQKEPPKLRTERLQVPIRWSFSIRVPATSFSARYDDIRDFLAQYIEEVEKPRGGNPVHLADQFLRFVKETAGLMIEVGSGLYSFVHLTFQEYLTATHLKKNGEAGGVGVIWDFIADRCGDARWHEVIRLLLGSFERAEAQEYFMERILPRQADEEDAHERSLLAGGCLLDRIDAAEELRDEIVEALVTSAISAEGVDALRGPLRILRSWQDTEADHRGFLAEVVARMSEEAGGEPEKTAAALILLCLGWDEWQMLQATNWLLSNNRANDVYVSCGLSGEGTTKFRGTDAERGSLIAARIALSLHSPGGNHAAISLGSLCPTEKRSGAGPGTHSPRLNRVRTTAFTPLLSSFLTVGCGLRLAMTIRARVLSPSLPN